ncbi:hypothetical protein [Maricaulis parjimensis]|uniref:hypothetical protein n=1 Tax=Maricaulis parjimensis TaxID=144023 RepID=UPI0019395A50|nr:hypothetical protein [Maricaulis parjimensis]
MSDTNETDRKSEDNLIQLGFARGVPMGIALGVAMGVALQNVALGISLGVVFAMSFSLVFGAAKAKELKKKQDAVQTGDASDEEKS